MIERRGGFGGFAQPGTREIINRSESDEIWADDARGWRVIGLNVSIVLVFLSAVVALGRYGAAILPSILLIMLAIVVMGWLTASDDDGAPAPSGNYETARAIWIIFVVFALAWIALYIFNPYIQENATGVYPLKFALPWWAIVIVFSILGAILYGVLDLRYSHRSSLFNRNWPPTYQQLDPRVGPYYDGGPTGLDDEMPQEQKPAMTREEIAELLSEAMSKKPVIRQDTLVLANRNGNGLHKSPAPGTDERLDSEQVSHVVREDDGRGHSYIYVVTGNHQSAKVSVALAEDFVRQAQIIGSSFRIWAQRGITESKLRTIRRALAVYGIIDLGDASIHDEIKWLLKPAEALAEFERIFNAQVPPYPTPQA